jgi:hypothetical protein
MNSKSLSLLLGVTAMAVVTPGLMPEKAAAFQLTSGTTSVNLNTTVLSSVGLNLTGSANTVAPAPGFLVGFQITPPPATTFNFESAPGSGLVQPPFTGLIRHTGTVTFNGGTAGALTVGNFAIGFDTNRVGGPRSGFFVRDTVTTNAILFDLGSPVTAFNQSNLSLAVSGNLLVSPELSGVLGNAQLAGANVGAANISATAVPEPLTILGTLLGGGFVSAAQRKQRAQAQPNRQLKQPI